MKWADRIREVRHRHRLKQEALAMTLGVSQSLVSQWERGLADPKPEMQDAIRSMLQTALPAIQLKQLEQHVKLANHPCALFRIRRGEFYLLNASAATWDDFQLLTPNDIGLKISGKLGEEATQFERMAVQEGLFTGQFAHIESLHTATRNGVTRFGTYRLTPFQLDHFDWLALGSFEAQPQPGLDHAQSSPVLNGARLVSWDEH